MTICLPFGIKQTSLKKEGVYISGAKSPDYLVGGAGYIQSAFNTWIIGRVIIILIYSSFDPLSPTNHCSLFLNNTLNVVKEP